MQPSSILCRAQEAHHHALARAATLENVRQVANAAATAWAKEGAAADMREGRALRARALVGAQAAQYEPSPADIRGLSENPDRGYADPG